MSEIIKENLLIEKKIDIDERVNSFKEVQIGLTQEEALIEASRCLNCKNPTCINGCPAHNNIPFFISHFKNNNLELAYETIKLTSNLPSICSRVCDQQKQCEGHCVKNRVGKPVKIGLLERYICDNFDSKSLKIAAEPQYFQKSVAVIGSGPAGISCALELAKSGVDVTIFEEKSEIGGLLRYGIPPYRLPKTVLDDAINELKNLNVKFEFNKKFSVDFTIEHLKYSGFAAIFVAIGSQKAKYMKIKGEESECLFNSTDFLYKVLNGEKPKVGPNVIVVGGGNAAIDAARVANRLHDVQKVSIVYRRTKEDMPASVSEINDALDEGIEIQTLTNPTEILLDCDGKINSLLCTKMKQTEPGNDGRRKVTPIEDSLFEIKTNTVIYAIGNDNENYIGEVKDFETDKWNQIIVDKEFRTTKDPSIFAGGDVVTGPKTVVDAMVSGRIAAEKILKYIKEN